MTDATAVQRARRAAGREHVIAEIQYTGFLPGEDHHYPTAPIRCSCGWMGVSAGWGDHRRAMGAGMAETGRNRRTKGSVDVVAMMKRVSMPSVTGDQGQGHPVLFGFAPAWEFDPHPDGGGYPIRFLTRAYPTLGVTDPTKVLHLCSGSVRIGTTVDIRPEMRPDIVADARSVPLPDESFDWVMADPPYSEDYAENLYGTRDSYPKPSQLLREASRLLRPSGRVGVLHFQVPMHRPPLRMVGVWGVSTGAGYAIRAWTVFEKAQQTLGLVR